MLANGEYKLSAGLYKQKLPFYRNLTLRQKGNSLTETRITFIQC